jgi:ornithine--oxo-acid transaminase
LAKGLTGDLSARTFPNANSGIYPTRFFGTDDKEHSYAKIFYDEHDVKFVKGEGSILIDDKGKEYWDAHSAYGVTLFGHSMGSLYGDVLSRIMNNEIPMTHGAFPKEGTQKAAKAIAQKTASCFGGPATDWQVYFNNTGAEAVDTSLKFARKHGSEVKKLSDSDKIVYALESCFHGRALGGTSLFSPDKKTSRDGFGPLLAGIKHLQMNDIDGLISLEKDGANTAAIILEPIQGEGGINMPAEKWIKELSKICKESIKYSDIDREKISEKREVIIG